MKESRVTFPCGELLLEGILGLPDGPDPFPAVIFCHPHPLYGGDMNNNVVDSLSDTLVRASFISFRFNFRGVGQSEGEFSQGIGEQEDVSAAIRFVSSVRAVDATRVGLVGYSAGTAFSLKTGTKDNIVKALAVVSPPLAMFDFHTLENCFKPKFLISGSKDDFTTGQQFLQFCQKLPEPKECIMIDGADHFWWGYEADLADKVVSFFTEILKMAYERG